MQVENLLKGEGINKKCTYWNCFLLAKYYTEQGLEPFDIRKNIRAWAEKYNVELETNLNRIIIDMPRENRRKLRDNVTVRISDTDIERISTCFDSSKSRRAALAMLCYAKAAADKDGYFYLPVAVFAGWIHQDYSYVLRHYVKEMKSMGFVESVKRSKKKRFSWEEQKEKSNFRILVPHHNTGNYVLVDNNIDALYVECFGDAL